MPKKKLGNGDLVTKYINHIKEDKTRGVSSGTIKTYTNIIFHSICFLANQ